MTVAPQQWTVQGNGLMVPDYRQQAVQPAARPQGISLLVHAPAKVGKSSVAVTGPPPVLVLDVETAANWTPGRKIVWDPLRQPVPPVADGTWRTCVVVVHNADVLHSTLAILNRGQHPFNSISVDSVPSIQQRVMTALAGLRKMDRDHWGVVLRQTTQVIWGYRDLLTHPTRPVWAVTYVCGTHYDQRTAKWRPFLFGQSADVVPYTPDLTGWMWIDDAGRRHLWTGPSDQFETGERLWGRLPFDMTIGHQGVPGLEGPGYWTVESMTEQVIRSSM